MVKVKDTHGDSKATTCRSRGPQLNNLDALPPPARARLNLFCEQVWGSW